MIPVLFEANTTNFSTLGIGLLPDTISARVKRVLNGKDELELAYPTSGERFNDIVNDRIILAQPEYKKDAQPYRIYQVTKPMKGSVKVYARHISEQKNFIPVMPFRASSLAQVFATLPQYVAESSPFTFWTDKSTTGEFSLSAPTSLGALLGGSAGSLLQRYGGEYEFDGYTVKLYNHRGLDRGIYIRYGKNLTKLEQQESLGNTITGVCPFWKNLDGTEVVTLPEKVVESQFAGLYAFNRTITRDFSEVFNEKPTEAQLRAAAQSYIEGNEIGKPSLSLSISFEHLAQYKEYENIVLLETVNLGDTVHVVYEALNISAEARAVETDYDVLREKYNAVKLGKVKANMSSTLQELGKSVENQFESVTTSLEQAISDATAKITGANGGYVVTHYNANGQPYEILIMDNPDIAQAVNVIRMNVEGIGFSQTGYEGPFRTAWTIDGHFVADFIDTGVLTANIIKAGILSDEAGINFWNMRTGEISIQAVSNLERIINNIGGRNLIINTLEPRVLNDDGDRDPSFYPRIYQQIDSTKTHDYLASVAEHGIRLTKGTSGGAILFNMGQPNPDDPQSSMNGLKAGETYTISFGLESKVMSNDSGAAHWRFLFASWDADDALTIQELYQPSITNGVRESFDMVSTFTIPDDAEKCCIQLRVAYDGTTTSPPAASHAADDFYELTNIKLEEGEVATAWTPAPEDESTLRENSIATQVGIVAGGLQTLTTQVNELDNGLTQRVTTIIEQDPLGVVVRVDDLTTDVDGMRGTVDNVNASFEFLSTGLKIKGTRGAAAGSYLNLAADEVALFVNNSKKLWLNAEGANADAFTANNYVAIGTYLWEVYPNGIRLRKKV